MVADCRDMGKHTASGFHVLSVSRARGEIQGTAIIVCILTMGRGWPKAGTSWGSKRAWGAQGAWGTHRTWWSQGSWGAHTSKAARGSGLLPGNCWGTRLHLRSQGASVGRGRKVETGIYVVSIIHLIGVGTNLLRTGNFAISVLFTVSCCSALKNHISSSFLGFRLRALHKSYVKQMLT